MPEIHESVGHFIFRRRAPKPKVERKQEPHYRESAEAAKLVDNLPPKPEGKS